MSSYILGTSHAYLSYIFGKSKTYSINISDMSKKHLKPISNISQAYLWQIMGIPYSCIWHFLYMSQIYLWHISGKFLFLIFQLILISLISIASQERNFVLVYILQWFILLMTKSLPSSLNLQGSSSWSACQFRLVFLTNLTSSRGNALHFTQVCSFCSFQV